MVNQIVKYINVITDLKLYLNNNEKTSRSLYNPTCMNHKKEKHLFISLIIMTSISVMLNFMIVLSVKERFF